mgnify:CR=1 FL=1
MYQLTTLKNGIKIVTKELGDAKTANLTASFNAGSKYAPKGKEGLAHLLEHLIMNGSPKYPDPLLVKRRLAEIGGWSNASTSREYAKYVLKILGENFKEGLEILFGSITAPLLTDENLEKEKRVIGEEINRSADSPQRRLADAFYAVIFSGHPFSVPVKGTRETLEKITLEDAESFYQGFYSSRNLVLAAAGNLAHGELVKLAERNLSSLASAELPPYKPFEFDPRGPRVSVLPEQSQQLRLLLAFPFKPKSFSEKARFRYLSRLLGGGGRLLARLREKEGLAYAVGAHFEYHADLSFIVVEGGFSLDKVPEVFYALTDELMKVKKVEIKKEEFERIKTVLKTGILFGFEDHNYWARFALNRLRMGEPLEPEDNLAELERIKPEEVQKLAREIFVPENAYLAVVHKDKKPEEFSRLLAEGLA